MIATHVKRTQELAGRNTRYLNVGGTVSIRVRIVTDYNPLSETEIHDFQLMYKQTVWKFKQNGLQVGERDFPGGLVVGAFPSNAGGMGSLSGQETQIPHASK